MPTQTVLRNSTNDTQGCCAVTTTLLLLSCPLLYCHYSPLLFCPLLYSHYSPLLLHFLHGYYYLLLRLTNHYVDFLGSPLYCSTHCLHSAAALHLCPHTNPPRHLRLLTRTLLRCRPSPRRPSMPGHSTPAGDSHRALLPSLLRRLGERLRRDLTCGIPVLTGDLLRGDLALLGDDPLHPSDCLLGALPVLSELHLWPLLGDLSLQLTDLIWPISLLAGLPTDGEAHLPRCIRRPHGGPPAERTAPLPCPWNITSLSSTNLENRGSSSDDHYNEKQKNMRRSSYLPTLQVQYSQCHNNHKITTLMYPLFCFSPKSLYTPRHPTGKRVRPTSLLSLPGWHLSNATGQNRHQRLWLYTLLA